MGSKTLSIFYINELIYKGSLKEDSYPLIFDSYGVKALKEISNVDSCLETALRKFEYSFLYSSGVISDLIATNSGEPVLPELKYKVVPVAVSFRDMECSTYSLSGDTLLQLSEGNRLDKTALRESKYLMRGLIEHFLDGKELATRNLFKSKGKKFMSTKVKPIVLGVNIDHVATLRQARRSINPQSHVALDALDGGADYITIHLREDRRHIQDFDLVELLKKISI